jgi:hypothetical protein
MPLRFMLHPTLNNALNSSGITTLLGQPLPRLVLASGGSDGVEGHIGSEKLVACLSPQMIIETPLQFLKIALAVLVGPGKQGVSHVTIRACHASAMRYCTFQAAP